VAAQLIESGIIRKFRDTLNFRQRQREAAKATAMVKVLFVCMGNICRSPVAEGVFRRMLEGAGLEQKVYVDSAGTHSYHVGAPPDPRSQATALRRGIDLRALRSRKVVVADFAQFDYVLAMDRDNLEQLLAYCQDPQLRGRIQLLMDYAPNLPEREVPDPYYGGPNGFERVMDLIETAAEGLLVNIRQRYRL
jgi:protein-tyrosine phosphatase